MRADQVRHEVGDHLVLALEVARTPAGNMRPGGMLLLIGGTGGRRISRDLGFVSGATAALPPFVATLALELAAVRVNLIAAGFVDTPWPRRTSPRRDSRLGARSCGGRSPSDGWSDRQTSPRSPSTSWPTPHSPARPMTSTVDSSSSPRKEQEPWSFSLSSSPTSRMEPQNPKSSSLQCRGGRLRQAGARRPSRPAVETAHGTRGEEGTGPIPRRAQGATRRSAQRAAAPRVDAGHG